MPASDRPGPPKVPLLCAICVGSLTCRPCTQRAHTSVEERHGVPASESRAPLAARPAKHASLPHSNASMKPTRVEAEKPTLDTRPFMTGPALNATPAKLLPSAVYLISYLNEAKRRPRIAHLRRSPISSFTILSTLTMAYEE